MRFVVALALLALCGCGPGLEFNDSRVMTPDQMLARADLVFVGVLVKQQFDSSPYLWLSIPGESAFQRHCWKLLRRQVRVDFVIRGVERRRKVQVYEYFWGCGLSGIWNHTVDGSRYLFLVRRESGKYHVVRDCYRSIFPVAGPHTRLPLDDSRPFWERVALMNWWIPRAGNGAESWAGVFRSDPGRALSSWRAVKLWRGLLRHPSQRIRVSACRSLMNTDLGQDECWDTLPAADFAELVSDTPLRSLKERRQRDAERGPRWFWNRYDDRDSRRIFTAHSNTHMRREFCRLYEREYPGDSDNGCPADRAPPATIVTEQGDVPLVGAWPQ